MSRHGTDTYVFTFANMLNAIGNSASLLEGRQVHALILRTGYDSDVNVQNGLISMYAICGEIGESRDVFASLQTPDTVSWNSLLPGYAQHGYGEEVVVEQMMRLNVQPDHTTFLLVLTACSHAGLVDKGLRVLQLDEKRQGSCRATARALRVHCRSARSSRQSPRGRVFGQ
jgi:hypothetical protein